MTIKFENVTDSVFFKKKKLEDFKCLNVFPYTPISLLLLLIINLNVFMYLIEKRSRTGEEV